MLKLIPLDLPPDARVVLSFANYLTLLDFAARGAKGTATDEAVCAHADWILDVTTAEGHTILVPHPRM